MRNPIATATFISTEATWLEAQMPTVVAGSSSFLVLRLMAWSREAEALSFAAFYRRAPQ
jgi:hypothetical protein